MNNNIQRALELVALIHDTTVEEVKKQLRGFFFFTAPEDIALIFANMLKAPEV